MEGGTEGAPVSPCSAFCPEASLLQAGAWPAQGADFLRES